MLEGKNPIYFIVPILLDSFALVFTVADLGDTRMRSQSNCFHFRAVLVFDELKVDRLFFSSIRGVFIL